MIRIVSIFAAVLGLGASASANSENKFALDYDRMVILDAEELAEAGIKEAYEKLIPDLKKYIDNPAKVIENIDDNLPSYSVSCLGQTYQIYSPITSDAEGKSWGRATYAIFEIINSQLIGVNIKFYAINGGNDLGGMFLTEQQVATAKKSLKNKTDWPYLPTLEHSWYGQFH
jgi:hypothetical protein